jgi:creatinine amidohydrolase
VASSSTDDDVPAEVRLERMRPAEVDAALERASVAWLPLGALEYHGPHLPIGTDGFTAHGLLVRAAERIGGVVLPWSYLTLGTLRFARTLRFEPGLVERALRDTLEQLAADGVRVLIVHTGHAPLDLIHLIKRVCAGVEASRPGVRAYGLCYLELNAALGVGLGTDWPVAVDHASTMETSWLQALEPELVDLGALPEAPDAAITAVYGPNPRATADPVRGAAQLDAAADLLAERVSGLLDGAALDPLADLRGFVERYWPEPLEIAVDAQGARLRNPGAVSRYLSGLALVVDGRPIDPSTVTIRNDAPGEAGIPVRAADLGAESGMYVRRGQTARLAIGGGWPAAVRSVALTLGLAGVTTTTIVWEANA